MALTFQEEKLATCLEEAKPLLERHWAEIARNKDRVPFAPSYSRYHKLEALQGLCICTARNDGILVGYAAFFVDFAFHYSKTKWAECDVVWISPDMRRPRTALRLIEFSIERLKARGVEVVHIRAKDAHPALGRILKHISFDPIETVYAKVL